MRERVRVTPAEQQLLEATLEFANLKNIRSTRQVENIFRRGPLAGPQFKILPPKEFRAYYGDQAHLRLWLKKIADLGMAARGAIGTEVAELLGTVPIRVTFEPTVHRLAAVFVLNGVQAAYSYAVALLLDQERGLTRRLGQCGYCKRFNFTLEGRPRMHCNADHRRRADARRAADRMRDLRSARKQLREVR